MASSMEEFDFEYFIVIQPRQDFEARNLFPYLSPDDDTAELPFRYKAIPFGSKPLVFVNGFKERWAQQKRETIKNPPPVMFEGSNPVVDTPIREKLLLLNVPNLEIQPSIYIDDWDKWHENYWYLTFTKRLDCWCRKRSSYDEDDDAEADSGHLSPSIDELRLDNEKLRKIPLEERRLFQLGGTTDAFVLAHMSVAPLFRGNGKSGAQVLSLSDYPDKW